MKKNKTLFQAFYWEMNTGDYAIEYPKEANLWQLIKERANSLAQAGITDIWLPPANKGHVGIYDVGYGSYDLWDLGEFEQKGTVRTKYGTKNELMDAISELHNNDLRVHYDAVLNHMMGADDTERVKLSENSPDLPEEEVEVWTKHSYPNRDKYSQFVWNWTHFNGTDWLADRERNGLFLFEGKQWDNTYCWEDDYLMGVDFDYLNPEVREEIKKWGCWLVNKISVNGFRLDAVRHIDVDFLDEWISELQSCTQEEIIFIGEAWFGDIKTITDYIDAVGNSCLKAFDFPLRSAFNQLSAGELDLRWFGGYGLVNAQGYKDKAVTFVDNHDTDRDEGGYGVEAILNRKHQAYTYILMREHGIPTVFWKDYYIYGMKEELDLLIKAREKFAYGKGHEVEANDYNNYAYVREGNEIGPGLVMMISQSEAGGIKEMQLNAQQANTSFYDYTGNVEGKVTTDENGYGTFKVQQSAGEGWSVWVPESS